MGDIRRILHVEDDPDIREIALLALSDLGGFDVLQCASGAEAVAHAEGFAPELLLLDVMMPGMSGFETLAALRKIAGLVQTPAIFMTSKDVSSQQHFEIHSTAIGAIQKPFDPVRLPDQLRQIVSDAQGI
ncbi:response regulator [Shimia sp. R11_0]|uniref:DNA-binding response regulator MtrA n=1 Tax=Shimia marina TaxID=321267 RepID=A0A0P1ESM3_9RHOB|nr:MULTISPECIES: response regulator [Shimia]MBO9478996.1 response regulator [Shimia sp. R11_0]CUH53169.1 DNA-binding response regulator MtrA [Shimia marina]SFD83145.1 Response regulator receiver domain-containing protein [Shimia marina]